MAKVELCAGHVAMPSFGGPTLTPLWGQAALYALKVPATGWTTRTSPTMVPPPTGMSEVLARLVAGEGGAAVAAACWAAAVAGGEGSSPQAVSRPAAPAP